MKNHSPAPRVRARAAGREDARPALALLFALLLGWCATSFAQTEVVVQQDAGDTAIVVDSVTPAPTATVISRPAEVVIERLGEPVTVNINTGPGPITAEDIRAARLLIDGIEYDANVNLNVVEGQVLMTPPADLPPGRYTLRLETATGPTDVIVYNPSADYPRTRERQAVVLGVTEPELEVSLGTTTQTPAATVALNLQPVYYQGQTILANMEVASNQYYSWKVNGKEVKYGQGDHTFVYTFKEPGQNVVTYTVREGNNIVASGIQAVDVVGRPVLVRRYVPGSEVSLTGPEGYSKYTWKVNGETVGTGQTLHRLFPNEGTHTVEVIAERPLDASEELDAMTYQFKVSAQ